MNRAIYFENELNAITDPALRSMVYDFMEYAVPDYFFSIGASSSGKYHPEFSQGEGGLVRHTKAVCMVADELLRVSPWCYLNDIFKDYVRAACILHDTMKYGTVEYDKEEYKHHGANASEEFRRYCLECYDYNVSEYLLDAIRTHMGQWSEKEDRPFTNIDRCVHMADYIASRKFIDIPAVRESYESVTTEIEIPFEE